MVSRGGTGVGGWPGTEQIRSSELGVSFHHPPVFRGDGRLKLTSIGGSTSTIVPTLQPVGRS
jgi:hypothetical protein